MAEVLGALVSDERYKLFRFWDALASHHFDDHGIGLGCLCGFEDLQGESARIGHVE